MTLVDWLLVLVINGGIVFYGIVSFRSKRKSFDWYMAAKSMPWWVVGLSAFGTAVDSGDYVALFGGVIQLRAFAAHTMVAGNFGRLDRPELLRRSPHVPVGGLYKRRVDGVPLWTFRPLPGRGDQYPAAHQCPGQYFLFNVPRAQCGGGHWDRLELGHRGRCGLHRGCLSRPRRPAGRGVYRRHTKYGDGGFLPGGVGCGVVEYGWLGRA